MAVLELQDVRDDRVGCEGLHKVAPRAVVAHTRRAAVAPSEKVGEGNIGWSGLFDRIERLGVWDDLNEPRGRAGRQDLVGGEAEGEAGVAEDPVELRDERNGKLLL